MNTRSVSAPAGSLRADGNGRQLRGTLVGPMVAFLLCFAALFVGMTRHPYIYDEGLVLTAAMRVAAGQVPHRDFTANYGPAQFYLLAGLFKVFGQSLLVERLYDLFIKALLVASFYAAASSYCRRSIAAAASFLATLFLFGLHDLVGTPVIPVSLLNMVGAVLILPIFARTLSTWRMFAAGAVAGLGLLFRYDIGIALFVVQLCVIACASFMRRSARPVRELVSNAWPLFFGLAVVVLPALLYFLSAAPFASFVHDLIVFPSQHYRRGRNLPFPRVYVKQLEYLEIYLPALIAAISVTIAVAPRRWIRDEGSASHSVDAPNWRGLLVTFGLLTAVMYMKGFVRASLGQMYLSIIPSLLLLAVLMENRFVLPRPARISVVCLSLLSVVAGTWLALHQVIGLYRFQVSLPSSARLSVPAIRQWCEERNPLTRGICFLPEDDRIRTIEFINRHTTPDQPLYVGLVRHDRVFANDNILYFATQRLPATHWSHFDPGLQSSYDIQEEMVRELQASAPPYIVLDSEFEGMREPNESSISSGVTLLDDYIRDRYVPVVSFGILSVWQRK